MYISINWIKDFVDLKGIDIDNLINRFTLSTAEVEGIHKYGADIKGVVVGKVISVEPHPNSNKLKAVKIDIGSEVVESLCGAPNVSVGMVIPFAPHGSLVLGQEVKKTEIAGLPTNGICLSERELGISDDHSGLMVLDDNLVLGTDIKEIMPIEDVVFEVDNKSLTNRPDLWGHYGIAREISALTGRSLKALDVDDLSVYSDLPKPSVKIIDTDKCYRYNAIIAENINRKVSNLQMRIRLFYTGTRAINLLADITNYVMLELGQPMHAFDKSFVDNVNIKTLGKEQMFKTLDGEDRKIFDDTLMICQGDKPVCIAGIMGGENTEIKDSTNSLFLESANFDSTCIRKSATKIGLRTEASSRYEKTLDPEMTAIAVARYLKLLKNMDPGAKVVSSFADEYVKKFDKVVLNITKDYVCKYIGVDISGDVILRTLVSLGFDVNRNGDNFEVHVPSYRATKDVTLKADLVEEISRIYGYDNILPKSTVSDLHVVGDEVSRKNDYVIKDLLATKYGFSEIYSYVWHNSKLNKELKIDVSDNFKILNSLNEADNNLRYSMIPSLLYSVYSNVKHCNGDINVFEIGKVFKYHNDGEPCKEYKNLGFVLASKELSEKELFFKAKSVVSDICTLTQNIVPEFDEINVIDDSLKFSWINPINRCAINYNGEIFGYLSVLNLGIKEAIDKKLNVVVVEIKVDRLSDYTKSENRYYEISKYQVVNFDLSFVVPKTLKYKTIEEYINEAGAKYVIGYSLVDVYEDNNVLGDNKSVTVKFLLGLDRTLTADEITADMDILIEHFEKKGIAIRK